MPRRLTSRAMPVHLVAALCCVFLAARLATAQPGISHITPAAVAPGQSTEVTLHGTKLNGRLRVWASFPAQIEMGGGQSSQTDEKAATCKVLVSSGAGLGIGGI